MKKLVAALVVLTLAAVVATAAAFGAAKPKLLGTDGPGFTISLKAGGKNVKKLAKGKYALTVNDRSSAHNFVIEGPGIERDVTEVPEVGKKTVVLNLRPGRYKFYCRPHESTMFGYITVK